MKYKRIIWVKTPKCGGNSLITTIDKANEGRNSPNEQRIHIVRHGAVEGVIGAKVSEPLYTFAFVRNPFDRIVSSYHFCIKKGWWKSEDLSIPSKIDFKKFVKKPLNKLQTEACQHTRPLTVHLSPHKELVSQGKIPPNLTYLDFIGKLENLQEDFNTVCDKVGFPRQQLPHNNKTDHQHYTAYYDDETREIVRENYAKDIEEFGYEFGE